MTAKGHEERFPPSRLNGSCRFSQGTFARTHGNGRDAPRKPDLYTAAEERASFELCGDSVPAKRSAGPHAHPRRVVLPRQPVRFRAKLTGSCNVSLFSRSKGKLGEPSMAITQVKTVKKTPAARSNPIRKTAGKPKAAPGVLKLVTTKAANKERAATSAPKPASMTGPLPPIVTLKHLAEWAGYNHGVAKKQAIEMFTGFVADIGRVLKKGSKIRIPNLGVLQ